MPPKSKITKACKAMKNLGYPEKTVRPVVKELLKLYEDNWMLIEEDNYRVLVEAILDSEEQKVSWLSTSDDCVVWSNQNGHLISHRHIMIYLNMDVSGSVKMDRHIKELNSRAPSSSEIVIVQKQRCYHYVKDITKGQEACEISLINEINEDQEIPCTCGGKLECEFAYTPGGLVKENFMNSFISKSYSVQQHDLFYCEDCPLERSNGGILVGKCKGHVTRKFIKECWYKCGCDMKCGNRVVQRGITAKLQVFMTPDRKGWGLRTLEDVPKGAFICEYVGEVVTNRELFERNIQNTGDKHTYPVLLDADWNSEDVVKDEEALCLDASVYGNIARFINHRCFDANLVGIPVEVETPDHHYYHLALFTTRKVNALEEITWDYGIDFNDCHPVKAFQCHCGSKFCRDRKSVKS
ncbi:hypothetical protein DH2020_004592 [Rehmannia glutinosa]|uniref:SET domain-containing protein n=1 Tax=Rehmannia glutinosa TaxID=99300 RepID=A0ABR0XPT4_REHGL